MGISAFTNAMGSFKKQTTHSGLDANAPYISSYGRGSDKSGGPGGFITLPDGGRFRRSTFYSRDIYNQIPGADRSFSDGRMFTSTVFGGVESSWWRMSSSGPDLQNYENQASVEALLKLGSNKADLGTNIVEAQRTAHEVIKPFLSLIKAYGYARRGLWSKVPSALGVDGRKIITGRTAAEMWLQFQYGWKPLMGDIHGLYQVLQRKSQKSMLISGSSSAGGSRQGSANKIEVWKGYGDCHWVIDQSVRTKLFGIVRSDALRRAGQVNLLNPASVAWEVTPFSFLIDWGMPVGNVLAAFTAVAGVDFLDGFVDRKTSGKYDYAGRPRTEPYIHMISNGSAHMETFRFDRRPLAGWPFPSFYFRNNPLSTPRIENAVALWRGNIGR